MPSLTTIIISSANRTIQSKEVAINDLHKSNMASYYFTASNFGEMDNRNIPIYP